MTVCSGNWDLSHRLGDARIAALTMGLFGDAYLPLFHHLGLTGHEERARRILSECLASCRQ